MMRITGALCFFSICLVALAALIFYVNRNQPNQYLADNGWTPLPGRPKKSEVWGTFRPVIGMKKTGGVVTDSDWRALSDLPVITKLIISNAKVDDNGGYAVRSRVARPFIGRVAERQEVSSSANNTDDASKSEKGN